MSKNNLFEVKGVSGRQYLIKTNPFWRQPTHLKFYFVWSIGRREKNPNGKIPNKATQKNTKEMRLSGLKGPESMLLDLSPGSWTQRNPSNQTSADTANAQRQCEGLGIVSVGLWDIGKL